MRLNWIGIVILLLAGLVLVHNLTAWKDIEFGDETTYLGSGLTFSIPFKGGAQWGPLYAAWYAFWHLFVPEIIDLYYFNWAILSVLAGIAVFLFLRSFHVSFWISVWLSVLFLFSNQNLPLNPKISIAPFCLILGTLAAIHFVKWPYFYRFLLVALVGLMCAYCRPEFYVSFLLGSALAVGCTWKEKFPKNKTFLGVTGFFILTVVGLHLMFDNPLLSGDSSRSAVAFQQHFVINYCHWTHQSEPVTIEAQLQLFHQVLGDDVQSFTDALQAQPSWTLKHLYTNIIHTITANLQNVFDTFYQTLFRGWYAAWRTALVGAVLLGIISLIDFRTTWRNFRQKQTNWAGFIALLVLILPSLIAAVLVYPRTHYLIFHLILMLWLIAFVVNYLTFRRILSIKPMYGSLLAGLSLLVFITIRFPEYHAKAPTPAADNVRFITKLQPNERLRVLERYWYRVFLKEPSDWIHVEEYTEGDFVKFVKKKNINFILMTQDMRTYFAQDVGFEAFLTEAKKMGFAKLKTNGHGDYLLIKRTLIQ